MIAQASGFTRNFLKEQNNSAYFRLKKIPCGFKQQARARHTGEKCGLECVSSGVFQWGVSTSMNYEESFTSSLQMAFNFRFEVQQ